MCTWQRRPTSPIRRFGRVDQATGHISTVATGTVDSLWGDKGGAIGAGQGTLLGLFVDPQENLFVGVGDVLGGFQGGRIRKIVGPL